MSDNQAIDSPYLDMFDTQAERAKVLPMVPKALPLGLLPADAPTVPRRGADITEALRCVAESYLVSVAELLSKDRHKGIAEGRGVACWLLRTLTRMSFPEIGRALGNRDHTTIMAAVKKCERRREEERGFEVFTDALAAAVKARMGTT